MAACSVAIETVTDEIKKAFWSREPYRHVALRFTVSNDEESGDNQRVELEALLPEVLVIGVPGGDAGWNPSHRHELEGQDFLAWSTDGGFGRCANGGVYLPPSTQTSDLLIVNLKPAISSIRMFWRLFAQVEDDPAEPFHPFQLELKRYVASL